MKTIIEVFNPVTEKVHLAINMDGKTPQEIAKAEVEAVRNFPVGYVSRVVEMVGGGES